MQQISDRVWDVLYRINSEISIACEGMEKLMLAGLKLPFALPFNTSVIITCSPTGCQNPIDTFNIIHSVIVNYTRFPVSNMSYVKLLNDQPVG